MNKSHGCAELVVADALLERHTAGTRAIISAQEEAAVTVGAARRDACATFLAFNNVPAMPISIDSPHITPLGTAIFSPRSIAVVGASDDPTKTAGRPVPYLRRCGFKGNVYVINPKRTVVQNEPAYASIESLPEVPDHAYIVVPTEGVLDAVEDCAAAGVPVATVLASGFSEAGAKGRQREARLCQIVKRTGIRLIGPSSLGVVNMHEQLVITANAAFAEPDLPKGSLFVASHSGSMLGALMSRGKERDIGFAGLVSVGSEADLCIGEICSLTLGDPNIRGYLLFLETIRKGRQLREFAIAAAARGKPVIAYKLGRSTAAAQLALSHTGALAGEDDVADAFFKDCGIARVETLEAFIEAPPLLARMPALAEFDHRPKVGVVTTTGGGAAMVVDQLGTRGVAVQTPSPETYDRLADVGIQVARGGIVDLTLAGTRYEVMNAALDVLLSASEFDLVVAVAGSSARFHPDLAVRPIIDSSNAQKPLVAFVVPHAPEALACLTRAGVPNFRTPEACADAIAATFARRIPKPLIDRPPQAAGSVTVLDELEAFSILDSLDIPRVTSVAISATEPAAPAWLQFPLVAKVLSAEIPHKTDVGGVVLDIDSAEALHLAVAKIRSDVKNHCPDLTVERVLLQPMVAGIGEVLVGYRVDAQVGPLVMLAGGGILTEIYRDRSLRLAPVGLETAREMISEVKTLRAYAGYRGKPAADLEALAHAVVALSQLAIRNDLNVLEAEVNPMLLLQKGVMAVDALITLA